MGRLTLAEQLNSAREQMEKVAAEAMEVKLANARLQEELSRMQRELAQRPTEAKIAELEKKLSDCETSKKYYEGQASNASKEIDAAHDLLDGIDGAPPHKYTPEGSNWERERSLVSRLAGTFVALARGTKA